MQLGSGVPVPGRGTQDTGEAERVVPRIDQILDIDARLHLRD
jgi:hypothetical protein